MNRPPYALLHKHYPDPASVSAEELFAWIGHQDKLTNPQWRNTCAIRVSLALLGAGMSLPGGFLTVQAGKYKDRQVEIRQDTLADQLTRAWGEPERFGTALLDWRVGLRHGVIRFIKLWGPYDEQGHIDLIAPYSANRLYCEGACYMQSAECWFWECP
jgi:hypothetical protein